MLSQPAHRSALSLAQEETRTQLQRLSELVEALPDGAYERVSGRCGSIGAQVRHVLDHIHALLRMTPESLVDYEARERGTQVEVDGETAIRAIDETARLVAIPVGAFDAPQVSVRMRLDERTGKPAELLSSPEREWAFVLSHTVHHFALISLMAEAIGATVPDGFGVAASTRRFRQSTLQPKAASA